MSDEIKNEELENTEIEPTNPTVEEPTENNTIEENDNKDITPEKKAKAAYIALRYLGVTPPSL